MYILFKFFIFLFYYLYIFFFFFFNDTATTEIYTLSLHDALPISRARTRLRGDPLAGGAEPGVGQTLEGVRGARERVERLGGAVAVLATVHLGQQLGQDPPGRARHSGRGLRLEVALHPAVPVDVGTVFFRHVGDRQHDFGPVRAFRKDGAEVEERAGGLDRGVGLVDHEDDGRRAAGLERGGVVAAVAEQLRAARVGCALGPEREVGHAGERRLVAHHDLERAGPLEPRQQPAGQEQGLGRRAGRDEGDRLAAGAPQHGGCAAQRLVPIGRVAPHQGRLDPVAAVHPAVVQPAVIADEVPVHLEVRPRAHAHHDVLAGIERDVAALRAAGADRRGLVQLPGASLVEEVFREQRAHRTEIHHVPGPGVVQARVRVDADVG